MSPITRRRGFTLIEMLIAMVVGVLVVTFTMQLIQKSMRSSVGADARISLDRNERFITTAVQRDLQEAGVDLQSSASFGSVYTNGDQLVILSVPYAGPVANQQPAPFYDVTLSAAQQAAPPTGVGNCGATCMLVNRTGKTWEPAIGDVLLFSTRTTRRLLTITTAPTVTATTATFQFANITTMLGHPAGMRNADGTMVQMTPQGNTVRRLQAIAYYRLGDSLMRATRVNTSGTPNGELFATGVRGWTVQYEFVNGTISSTATPTTDGLAFDDIAGMHLTAQLISERDDPRAGVAPAMRSYKWFVAPRNLTYERNKDASGFN